MRHNRILGVAIAATLALPVGVAQAVGLENVSDGHKGVPAADATAGGHVLCSAADVGTVTGCDLEGQPGPAFDEILGANAVVNVPADGITYAAELFGGDGPSKLPNSNTQRAATLYTISTLTDITENLKVIYTLSDGFFVSKPKLAISDTAGNFTTLPIDIDGGNDTDNSITFLVDASSSKPLKDGDQLLLVYQFHQASSLATATSVVKLTAEVRNKTTDGIVNPTRNTSIATSKQVVTAQLKSEDTGVIKISVSDESKKFTHSGSGAGGAFIDEKTAQIGFLNISNGGGAYESDGVTLFKIGEGSDGKIKPGTDTGGSKLTITNGQFAASKTLPGKVYLNDAPEVTGEVNDDTTTTFDLTDAILSQVSDKGDLGIHLAVDGTTEIGPASTEASPPQAELIIDFEQDYVTDIGITTPVVEELRQIYKDGTVCVVYNVPSTAVTREKINIRITNDSNVDGALSGKLYKENGDLIGSGSLGNVTKGKTVVFNAASLEGFFGPWDGRAVLEITSTLPRLEVLALMRNQFDRSLLTNLSVGATGESCTR